MSESRPEDRVSSILTKDVLTIDASETLKTALKKMLKEDVGSLPVMKKGKTVGIITERDIARIYTEKDLGSLDRNVESVMSSPPITIGPETPILEALEIMLGNRIRRLPVTKDDKLSGIVTERDIVVWILKETYKPFIPEHLRKFVDKIDSLQKL